MLCGTHLFFEAGRRSGGFRKAYTHPTELQSTTAHRFGRICQPLFVVKLPGHALRGRVAAAAFWQRRTPAP